jgi:hypothetical protein
MSYGKFDLIFGISYGDKYTANPKHKDDPHLINY